MLGQSDLATMRMDVPPGGVTRSTVPADEPVVGGVVTWHQRPSRCRGQLAGCRIDV